VQDNLHFLTPIVVLCKQYGTRDKLGFMSFSKRRAPTCFFLSRCGNSINFIYAEVSRFLLKFVFRNKLPRTDCVSRELCDDSNNLFSRRDHHFLSVPRRIFPGKPIASSLFINPNNPRFHGRPHPLVSRLFSR